MSVESVREIFKKDHLEELVLYSDIVSDTVEHAAEVIGCEPRQIAKTMSFLLKEEAVVVVTSGDAKIDNPKFKAYFSTKPKMVPFDAVEEMTGHLPGGICPFGLKDGVKVYLDISLKRFDVVYTGGGDEHNTVKVTIPQLEKYSEYTEWIDVCKNWNE